MAKHKSKVLLMSKLPAVELKQHGQSMYAFVAESAQLLKICTVSRREEDDEKGYQRHLKDSRLRQLAHYVDDDKGVIPNNIVVNFFSPAVYFKSGYIHFPSNQISAWVIDGQHRLFGFKAAKSKYPLLVVAFIGLKIEKQVEIFSVINTEQKKLPTSLAIDLLKFVGDPEKDLNTRCRELISQLNEEPDSPWHQQINMTGEGVGAIALVNFVRKLRPLLDTGGVLHSYTFEEQYGAIENYWAAISGVFTDQWGAKGSLLTKTLGFGALMNVFSMVFTKTMAMKDGGFTVPDLIGVFKLIKDFKFDAETLGSGSGNKAEMAAAKVIEEELTSAISVGQPKKTLLKL